MSGHFFKLSGLLLKQLEEEKKMAERKKSENKAVACKGINA